MTESTLFQQLLEILQGKEGQILTSTQIKKWMEREYGANPSSVIPTDYCYNRINAGIAFDRHLFVRVARSEFKFVGLNYSYSGRVFWHPKGGDHEQIVAEWENGTLRYLDGFDTLAMALAQELAESRVSNCATHRCTIA